MTEGLSMMPRLLLGIGLFFSSGVFAAPLFDSDELLDISLSAPFELIDQERDKEKEYPGTLSYEDPELGPTTLDAKFSVRGNFRLRKDVCSHAQLWVNLKKSQVKGTLFAKQNKLKLVVQCKDSDRYAEYIGREQQAYQIFQTLSEISLATRMLKVTYADSNGEDSREQLGFFIQHQGRLAKQSDMSLYKENRAEKARLDPDHSALVALFMYLVSNTDYSFIAAAPGDTCCHNIKLLESTDGTLYPLPYDYDSTGFVNTSYAEPAGGIGQSNVKQRMYRGPDTAKIIRHLMKLEAQAKKAGGRVHALIGNHEVMNMTGDLRYVHPGEYEALRSRRSRRLQDDYYRRVVDFLSSQEDPVEIDKAFREQWLTEHPLGYVEHRRYWHPEGEFGAWVASHNSIIRINRSLFVHGGISPDYLDQSIESINDAVRAELATTSVSDLKIVDDQRGPLWYRGLAMGEETSVVAEEVEALLARYDVDRIVLGHTPGYGTVVPRYQAQVLVADSGLAQHYGGHLASLLIEDGKAYTIQRGEQVVLPITEAGLLDYYRAINEIEPDVNNLLYRIKQLEELGLPE